MRRKLDTEEIRKIGNSDGMSAEQLEIVVPVAKILDSEQNATDFKNQTAHPPFLEIRW